MIKAGKLSQLYLYAAGIISLIIFLVHLSTGVTREPVLKQGMKMPSLEYLSERGLIRLKPDTVQYTLLILFNRDCGICTGQMDAMNEEYTLHDRIDVIYITSDVQFLVAGDSKRWQNLKSNQKIRFGIVRRNDFRKYFGSMVTPSYYLFNQRGLLVWMAKGKVPLNQVNEIMLRSISG
jgi:hypothetical protein